ncbi:hypothetical protein [uncultured Brevundimonas sp.]|uniref:hypothetical protein n=1 Tax=uncultured Brevundimonas sp. TaxID=213418 RepID=UPI002632E146|nr:hypothetical protein [uncultured Brevundimonas sp.]
MFSALRAALRDLSTGDLGLYRVSMPRGLLDGTLPAKAIEGLGFEATPAWLTLHFSEQAVREAVGASALKLVASRLPEGNVRDLIEQHAIDESRHQKIFRRLSELHGGCDLHEDSTEMTVREEETLAVINHADFHFPNFIVDTHISEVNSLCHLTFIRGELIKSGADDAVRKAISSLISDEKYHVLYTARMCVHFLKRNSAHKSYVARSTKYFFEGSI